MLKLNYLVSIVTIDYERNDVGKALYKRVYNSQIEPLYFCLMKGMTLAKLCTREYTLTD